jgi:hypothetical protein
MRLFGAVTDNEWFSLHASSNCVDEVNFWRPSPEATFKAIQPGELLLFKLYAPLDFTAGGGFFVCFDQLPVNMAWDTFREANGIRSLSEMRERIAFYRRTPMRWTSSCVLQSVTARVLRESRRARNLGSRFPRPRLSQIAIRSTSSRETSSPRRSRGATGRRECMNLMGGAATAPFTLDNGFYRVMSQEDARVQESQSAPGETRQTR